MKLLILSILSLAAYAQTPTITGITVWSGAAQQSGCTVASAGCTGDTNTVTIQFTTSDTTGFCQVEYGVASGVYLWESQSFSSSAVGILNYPAGLCQVPTAGLKDGLTYYFLPTARPDQDDDANICNAAACGALEQVVTMPASTVSHAAAPPASVALWCLAPPDTSAGYVVVPLSNSGPGSECAAQTAVTAPEGYTGTINVGDTLTTILTPANGKIWYGTRFQIPSPVTCLVPEALAAWYDPSGYTIPNLPPDPCAGGLAPACTAGTIDSPGHRSIIFETTPAVNLPPFGFRMDPSLFTLGGFEANHPALNGASMNGIIFQMNGGSSNPVHHVVVRNLEFSVDASQAVGYGSFLKFGNPEGGDNPPYADYIQVRGNYFHGPLAMAVYSTTSYLPAVTAVMNGVASNFAVADNYADNLWYFPGHIPLFAYITDPSGGACHSVGPMLFDNNGIIGSMAQDFYFESNHSQCPADFLDVTVTHNDVYLPAAALPIANAFSAQGLIPMRDVFENKSGKRFLYQGNYVNGEASGVGNGEIAVLMSIGQTSDIAFRSNICTKVGSVFAFSGAGNNSVAMPNLSVGQRYEASNNICYDLGRGNYNVASSTGAGSYALSASGMPTNVLFDHNTFSPFANGNAYAPWVLLDAGGDNGPTAGWTVTNNVWPAGFLTAMGTSGIYTFPQLTASGNVSHPTVSAANGNGSFAQQNYTAWLQSGFGVTDGAACQGVQSVSVASGGTGYPATGPVAFTGCAIRAPVAAFTATAGVINAITMTDFGSGCTPGGTTATASTAAGGTGATLKTWYGLTPAYTWSGNQMVGTSYNAADMTDDQVASAFATMPPGDTWPTGGTTAARYASAGYAGLLAGNGSCTSSSACTAGANVNTAAQESGFVTGLSVIPSSTAAVFNYTAPDARACAIDMSPDGSTWTRATDAGGAGPRVTTIPGLTGGLTYKYRLMCYFDQSAASNWLVFPSISSSLATDGSFMTPAACPSPAVASLAVK